MRGADPQRLASGRLKLPLVPCGGPCPPFRLGWVAAERGNELSRSATTPRSRVRKPTKQVRAARAPVRAGRPVPYAGVRMDRARSGRAAAHGAARSARRTRAPATAPCSRSGGARHAGANASPALSPCAWRRGMRLSGPAAPPEQAEPTVDPANAVPAGPDWLPGRQRDEVSGGVARRCDSVLSVRARAGGDLMLPQSNARAGLWRRRPRKNWSRRA